MKTFFHRNSRSFTRVICGVALMMALAAGGTMLTSCDADWGPVPPYGWNDTFYDRALVGKWQLVQANGRPVSRYDTNYLDFYGNGRGMYYFYRNNRPYSERLAYWCQNSVSSLSPYQINIQYEDGSSSTMNYWFKDGGDTLWMQWTTGGSVVTYVYRAIGQIDL